MKVPQISYFLGELRRNLRRQPMLVITSIASVAVSFLLVGFFGGIWLEADKRLETFGSQVHVTILLNQGSNNKAVMDAVEETFGVRGRFYDSKQDLEHNTKLLKEFLGKKRAKFLEDLIPRRPKIEIVLPPKDRKKVKVEHYIKDFKKKTDELEEIDGVFSVLTGGQNVQLAYALVGAIQWFGALLSVLILVVSLFFIFSTIRLSVHARKEEIAIRQLMGASPGFISMPFYLEGIVVGALGGLVAFIVLAILVDRFNTQMLDTMGLQQSLEFLSMKLGALFLTMGVAIGLAGSALAVGRYLKLNR
ncbi:MAG: hypothetical protein CMH54_11500 [Myxococcales bacterium]|nr:hypothetical protein [Myxococcales bacterium]|tara:strand:+ start:2564 stop:3478 length:915 start_codon:yes stop_codon:yes gene_type:complete